MTTYTKIIEPEIFVSTRQVVMIGLLATSLTSGLIYESKDNNIYNDSQKIVGESIQLSGFSDVSNKLNSPVLAVENREVPNFLNSLSNASRKKINMKKIDEIKEFGNNWNGYGASPFSHEFLENIGEILNGIVVQPEIFPTSRESIQFEYNFFENKYLEFELYADKIALFKEIDDNEVESVTTLGSVSEFIEFINREVR